MFSSTLQILILHKNNACHISYRYFTQGDVLDKVPTCFVILGAIYFGLQLLGLAFTSESPTSKVHVSLVFSSKHVPRRVQKQYACN